MKMIIKKLVNDKTQLAGVLLIGISAGILWLTSTIEGKSMEGAFIANYIISIAYLIAGLTRLSILRRLNIRSGKLEIYVMMLILFFISAFALNREMNVFESSVTWLAVWLILSCVALLVSLFYEHLQGFLKAILFFMLGAAFLLFSYYAIYLLPLYGVSLIGLIALGISIHTYIPALLAIVTFLIMRRACKQQPKLVYACSAGVAVPIIIAVFYIISWQRVNDQINLLLNKNTLNESKLPGWVTLSQRLEKSFIAEHIIKAGLVYHEAAINGNWFFGGMPARSFDEPKQHDPLVVLATLFGKRPALDDDEKIKILASRYDARHHAQDRLWNGDHLETVNVISNVKLFPEYRMAYTEKTISVQNHAHQSWNPQEEAIYTFHLPEGSVISSLSLWIDGKQIPSRLSTKAKADSAYRQIVGVEQHDPSVLHWQEGNTVSVRIFPCTPAEERKFRIGITSPLKKEGNRLVYENAWFEGPAAANALETLQVSFSARPTGLTIPDYFTSSGIDTYQADQPYRPDWKVSFTAPPLATTGFTFNHAGYQVKNYEPLCEPFTPAAVYLDINSSWSKQEFMLVWEKVKNIPVYVYQDKLTRLTAGNAEKAFELLHTENFSLFPVNVIKNPGAALLISKSSGLTPNLHDLDGSEFAQELTSWLRKSQPPVRMFHIGDDPGPYLLSLKELRVFNADQGSVDRLLTLLRTHQFLKSQENAGHVVISKSHIMIEKSSDTTAVTTAPDHLLRLFAYNDIMRKTGTNYFNQSYIRPDIMSEADQAYIVSPVSSLIVLETQKDDERFGISESKNSLQNASMKSSGAVPEPKEWLLIILCASIFIYVIYLSNFAGEEA
jgi:XrtN system VIT domain protein